MSQSHAKMTSARINLRNIDYFKFKKLVIDGNRDDYNACSKEVRALCDSVQTLKFRDEEFDDESDRGRFSEICSYYKQILVSKRIDQIDVRIKSGWWGEHKNAYSAGKLKPAVLKEKLISKAKDWARRHGSSDTYVEKLANKIDGPGLYVFKHKDHQCFQFVGRADKIFAKVAEKLRMSFDGSLKEPLAALLIISMDTDWDFYFTVVGDHDEENILRPLENDLILKHDCIWPHGLNFRLHVDSLLEVSEFRKSCLRHHWPPSGEVESGEIDLERLRQQVACGEQDLILTLNSTVIEPITPKEKKAPPKPAWQDILHSGKVKGLTDLSPDSLDGYALSIVSDAVSEATYASSSSTDTVDSDVTNVTCKTDRTYVVKPGPGSKPTTPRKTAMQRPTSAGKSRTGGSRPAARKPTDSPRRTGVVPTEKRPRSRPGTPKKSNPVIETPVKDDEEQAVQESQAPQKRQLEVIIPTNGQEVGSGSEDDLSKTSKTASLSSLSSIGEGIKENESPVVNPPTIAPGGTAMFIALDSPKRQAKTSGGRPVSAKRAGGKAERSRLPQASRGGGTSVRR